MSMTNVYPGMGGDDEPPASDGAALLDDIRDTITRFCVIPGGHQLVAVALWVVLTHLLNRFDYAPHLVIRSAEKRSGKSRLLEIIGGLAYKPIRTANCTAAYIYRSLDAGKDTPPPTLLYDEADAIFGTKSRRE